MAQELLGHSGTVQAFYLRLSEPVLKNVLANPISLSLLLGPSPAIKAGSSVHALTAVPEPGIVNLYKASECIGTVSHKFTLDKHIEKPPSSNQHASQPSQASISHVYKVSSPRHVNVLAPASPKPSHLLSKRTLYMRTLHLLAVEQPAKPSRLAQRTKVGVDEILNILPTFAVKQDDESWVLTDSAYKDLRVWEWTSYTSVERTKLIAKATDAFERLGMDKDDVVWQNLVDPSERTYERLERASGVAEKAELHESETTDMIGTNNNEALKKPEQEANNEKKHTADKIEASKSGTADKAESNNNLIERAGTARGETKSEKRETKDKIDKRKRAGTTVLTSHKKQRGHKELSEKEMQEMRALARKFRKMYQEYQRLFDDVANAKKNGVDDSDGERARKRDRLLSMHSQLQAWKSTLWSVSTDERRVASDERAK